MDENEVVAGTEEAVSGGTTDALGGTSSQPQEVSENPAWAPYVEKFPEVLQPLAKETFSEWDKGVQSRFQAIHEQYRPFKQYLDQGVDPKKLESAWGLAGLLEKDPRGFAELLTQQLGLSINDAAAVTEELGQQQEGSEEELDPRLAQFQEQQEAMLQYLVEKEQSEQARQIQEQQDQQLDAELRQLEDAHGKLEPVVKNQILKEALRLSVETDKPVTLQQAYESLESFVSAVRNAPRAGQTAPRVMPSGSSIPVTPPDKTLGQMSPKETKEYVAQLLARRLEEQ